MPHSKIREKTQEPDLYKQPTSTQREKSEKIADPKSPKREKQGQMPKYRLRTHKYRDAQNQNHKEKADQNAQNTEVPKSIIGEKSRPGPHLHPPAAQAKLAHKRLP